MPPKRKLGYATQRQRNREAARKKRLQETAEQRQRRHIQQRTYVAQIRAQKRDLFTRQVEMCQELYETIRNHKTKGNRLLCQSFIRAPNRMSLPDYYDVILFPIDLRRIQQKLKAEEYLDLKQFTSDVELLFANALIYYKESSQEHQDAGELWKVFSDAIIRLESAAQQCPSATLAPAKSKELTDCMEGYKSEDVNQLQAKLCQELYDIIINHKTVEGRQQFQSFIRLPNRCILPDYYDIVTSPIDLLRIKQKLKTKEYIDTQQFSSDIELMVSNAKSYYEKNSQEYQNACLLWKVFSNAKINKEKDIPREVKEAAATLRNAVVMKKKRSYEAKRKKCRPLRSKHTACAQRVSSSLVKIKEKRMDPIEDENDSEPKGELSNAQWRLYETVENFTDSKGRKLSELFWKMSSRSHYPDCYNKVKQPISLCTIRTKIKKRQYSSLVKVVADMNLIFKHAKMYNIADSKLFKSAVILEKVMQAKAKELINNRWKRQQEETHADLLSNVPQFLSESTQESTSNGKENRLYKCLWEDCECQFEDHRDLIDHLVMEPNGHIWQTELKCLWYNCGKFKNHIKPFPSVYHLGRHMKQVHLRKLLINVLPKNCKKKEELAVIRSSQSTSLCVDLIDLVETEPPNHALVSQPAADYAFEGKCKKCNFSDMNACADITDGYNARLVLKCTMCPTTKVIGKEYLSMKDKHPTSQISIIEKSKVPRIDFPQVNPIKEELILPDDGRIPSFINSSSEPTRVEMMFNVDQDESLPEPGSVPSDTHTVMDATESPATTPDAFVHTQTSLISPILRLYLKNRLNVIMSKQKRLPISDDDTSAKHLQPHAKPQRTMQMRELPNYPNRLVIGKKIPPCIGSPQIPFTGQLQVQPVITHQVPANLQSQQSGINMAEVPAIDQSQDPLINFPQVASIKQEFILPDDETNPSFFNSSSEPIRVENIFCLNQDESTAKLRNMPSDTLVEELPVIRSSQSDPTTFVVEAKPSIDALVTFASKFEFS